MSRYDEFNRRLLAPYQTPFTTFFPWLAYHLDGKATNKSLELSGPETGLLIKTENPQELSPANSNP